MTWSHHQSYASVETKNQGKCAEGQSRQLEESGHLAY